MQKCNTCGREVMNNGMAIAHIGGGSKEQLCRNCGWEGGQIGGFEKCPRCGDMTQLIVSHTAN